MIVVDVTEVESMKPLNLSLNNSEKYKVKFLYL